MNFSSWSWWPSNFHLVLAVVLLLRIVCLHEVVLYFLLFPATTYAPLLWITRYRLKYLLRISLLSYILVHLIQKSSQQSPTLDFLQSVLKQVTIVMMVVRLFWSNPLEIERKPIEQSKGLRSKGRIRKRGDPDELPPVFPNGWIPVVQTSEIPKKGVLPVSVLGQKLVVFRGCDSGQVFVLDAYCPHLGADLGEKGRVEGDCIKCPFHGWQFRGEDGMCSHIPNSNTIPSLAKVPSWRCVERNGFVFVWHHAEGEEPSWEIPALPQVESGAWKYRGKTEHVAHCHMQEIPENGADVAHLYQLHSRSVFSGGEWMSDPGWLEKIVDHEWTPDWRPDEERAHVGRMTLSQRCLVAGFALPLFTINMEIQQIGPAVVQMRLKTKFGEGVFLQHVIPEGPLRMRVVHLLFTEFKFVQLCASLLIYAEAYMFDRDVAVWNHKRLLRSPVLVREDRLIARYRRWYSQFYSASSPTLREVLDRSLDW